MISVIIPCYNAAEHIEKCLASVLSQTYKNLEIICIDNNSQDDTWRILNEKKNQIPQLQIAQEFKQGASAARNKGISMAKGKWLQFLDADDILLPDKIQHQADLLNKFPDSSLIVGSYQIVNPDGTRSSFIVRPGNKWEKLIDGSLGCTISNLFKKESVIEAGGWDESQKSSQEFKLMFDILKNAPASTILYDSEANAVYQKRAEGSISNNYADNLIRYIELRSKIWSFLKEKNIKEVQEEFYLNAIFHKLRMLYSFDAGKAIEYYKNYIPGSFVPIKTMLTPLYYIILYKILGFASAEHIIKTLKPKD